MRAVLLLGLGLLGGCACTDVGCVDGLSVGFDRPPTTPFRVEVLAADRHAPRVFECPDPALCPSRAFFFLTTDQVTIRVSSGTGVVERTVRPSYRPVYPNGRGCGAACRQASVRVPFPA